MLNITLITYEDVQAAKQLSNNNYREKFNQCVREAQLQDLKPLLGRDLFNDLLRETTVTNSTKYTELMDGGDYLDGTKTYYNVGVKAVLIEYVYARLIMFGDVVNNPFGFTNKSNDQNSKLLDIGTKKTNYNNGRQQAYDLWLELRRFLICKRFALYTSCKKRPNTTLRFSKIGKRSRRRSGGVSSLGVSSVDSGSQIIQDSYPFLTIGGDRIKKGDSNTNREIIEIGDVILYKKITNAGEPFTLFGYTYKGGDFELLTSYSLDDEIA
jgi:hypothetical protein